MKRKLIKQGGGGFTFYVPKKWADTNHLKPGDEIEITESTNNLVISPVLAKPEKKTIKINAVGKPEFLIRFETTFAYNKGFDVIDLSYKSKKEFDTIKDTADHLLLGFDLTERSENSIKIENVAEPSEDKQQTILRRLFLTTLESLAELKKELESGKFDKYSYFLEISQKGYLYYNYCMRNIAKKRFVSEHLPDYTVIYSYLIMIHNSIFHLYSLLKDEKKQQIAEQTIKELERFTELYRMTYEAFFAEDVSKCRKAADLSVQHRNELSKVYLRKTKETDTIITHFIAHMLWHLSIIARWSVVIFEFR